MRTPLSVALTLALAGYFHAALAETALSPSKSLADRMQELAQAGRIKEALAAGEGALQDLRKDTVKNAMAIASVENNLGSVLLNIGEMDKADLLFEHAWQTFRKQAGATTKELAILLNNQAIVYQAKARHKEGLARLREGVRLLGPAGEQEPMYGLVLMQKAGYERHLGQRDSSLASFKKSIAFMSQALGDNHFNVAVAKNNYGEACFDAGRYAEALRLYEESESVFARQWQPDDPNFAGSFNNRGKAELKLGHADKAEMLLLKSMELAQRADKDDPALEETYGWLTELYTSAKRPKDSAKYAVLRDRIRGAKKYPGEKAAILNRKADD